MMIPFSYPARTVFVFAIIGMGALLAAPPVDAGMRDTLANIHDTMSCTKQAVFNPLKVFKWGMRHAEQLTAEAYNRRADQTLNESGSECLEAAQNIVSRGFGIKHAVDKVKNATALAKSATARVSRWFGDHAPTTPDPRMVLSVDKEERSFYEQETGVLGRTPLPVVDNPVRQRLNAFETRDDAAYHGNPAPDPWSDDASNPSQDVWEPTAWNEADPWGQDNPNGEWNEWDTEVPAAEEAGIAYIAPRNDLTDEEKAVVDYTVALDEIYEETTQTEDFQGDYMSALVVLEQQEAERQRQEREAEEAERLAAQQREEWRASRDRQLAAQQAELKRAQQGTQSALQHIMKRFAKGFTKAASAKKREAEKERRRGRCARVWYENGSLRSTGFDQECR